MTRRAPTIEAIVAEFEQEIARAPRFCYVDRSLLQALIDDWRRLGRELEIERFNVAARDRMTRPPIDDEPYPMGPHGGALMDPDDPNYGQGEPEGALRYIRDRYGDAPPVPYAQGGMIRRGRDDRFHDADGT